MQNFQEIYSMNFARIFQKVRLRYLMTVLAFLIGVFLPLQVAINNALKTDVGDSTLLAAFVSFGVGTNGSVFLEYRCGISQWLNCREQYCSSRG